MEVWFIISLPHSFIDVQLIGPGCSSGIGLLFELGASIALHDTIHLNNWKTRAL